VGSQTIRNPVLRGFNPDPSICRVGDDYYMATSTFEWFPGVQVHHSRDLVHWHLLTRPLDRVSQLNLRGVPASCGVWAPCLSWDRGLFYLVYTIVYDVPARHWQHVNFVVTAPQITGPWSEPVQLNASGFDPSLFHDDDGRKYLVNMYYDGRGTGTCFAGIVLQEIDPVALRLTGLAKKIWGGTALRVTEGPHLYKKDGWYYLVCAEGGTHFGHAVSVARSADLWGPYETHPENPLLTSRDCPEYPFQKAGHASVVQTQQGEWYMAHLIGRPLRNPEFGDGNPQHRERMCILGRETAIQKLVWPQGEWPQMAHGSRLPAQEVAAPELSAQPWPEPTELESFDAPTLRLPFQTLREPFDANWGSLSARPGWLRLRGRNHLSSAFEQSLVARRVEHFTAEVATCIDFSPQTFKQQAGLAAYYDASSWYSLRISRDDAGRRVLELETSDVWKIQSFPEATVVLPPAGSVVLAFCLDGPWMQFCWGPCETRLQPIGPKLNSTYLSDDAAGNMRFTGLFAALSCSDCESRSCFADFDWFRYCVG
jgi:xylan 1,4-beta-xylosidase